MSTAPSIRHAAMPPRLRVAEPEDAGQTPPVPLAWLVGREREVAAVCALLRRADVRLLTLIGPDGMGKTRLGPAAATALAEVFDDGIWFIPLDPISDPALVAPTI